MLLQVFMAIFDIMHSHFSMTQWHEAGLVQHRADLASIQTAKAACKQRMLQQSLASQFLGKPSISINQKSLAYQAQQAQQVQQAHQAQQEFPQPSTPLQQPIRRAAEQARSPTLVAQQPMQDMPNQADLDKPLTAYQLPSSPQQQDQNHNAYLSPQVQPEQQIQQARHAQQGQQSQQRPPALQEPQAQQSQEVPQAQRVQQSQQAQQAQQAQQDCSKPSITVEASSTTLRMTPARPTVRFDSEACASPEEPSLAMGVTRPWQQPHGIHTPLHAPMQGMPGGGDEVQDVQQQKRAELQVRQNTVYVSWLS